MNTTATEFKTLKTDDQRLNEVLTMGEHFTGGFSVYVGLRENWLVVLAKARDSSILEETNFSEAKKMLTLEQIPFEVESAGHFACGHIDYLLIKDTGKNRLFISSLLGAMDAYPILNEDAYSEACYDSVLKMFDVSDFINALNLEISENEELKNWIEYDPERACELWATLAYEEGEEGMPDYYLSNDIGIEDVLKFKEEWEKRNQ